MYSALDNFLAVDTWHTSHSYDLERFHKALDRMVREPDFNPDRMGEYIRARVSNPAMEYAVERLVSNAWAIQDFLAHTGQLER